MNDHLINYNEKEIKKQFLKIANLRENNKKLIEYLYNQKSDNNVIKYCVFKLNENINNIKTIKYHIKRLQKEINDINHESEVNDI